MSPISYSPADSSITREALEFLHSAGGSELRDRVAAILLENGTPTVSAIAALRKNYPADIVHAALTLGQLQKKARQKFPVLPFTWAVPEALEQATDARVAAHKAARFAALHPEKILDLCSGIGGDAMALAPVAPLTAVDLSPIRTACLRYNLDALQLHAEIRTQDLRTLISDSKTPVSASSHAPSYGAKKMANPAHTLATFSWPSSPGHPSTFFHIDPARRAAGKRSPAFDDLIPGPDLLFSLLAKFPTGALKLSPAIDFASLPPGHLEIIGRNRTVVQAVLWTGQLAHQFPPETRTATLISDDGATFSHTARPEHPATTHSVSTYLFEADPALTRAGIAGVMARDLGLVPLTVDGGYLTGSHLLRHPALTPFRAILTLPYTQERVSAALSHLPPGAAGPVEVKTRGSISGVNTDQLQLIWSAATTFRRTVLIYRLGNDVVATLAERV